MKTNLNFIEDISSVDKSAYERLLNTNDSPFIKHSFLEALETSGCVSDIKGWKVNHLVSKKDGLWMVFCQSILKIIVMESLFLITLGLMH